jgi:hypothetical protein
MVSWLAIALWIVLGWLAALGARSRGRSPMAWFLLGSLLGWWGLLLLYLLPPLLPEEAVSGAAMTPPGEKSAVPNPLEQSRDWFFLDQAKTACGPLTGKALKEKWKAGQLGSSSWVWNDSIVDWKKISQVQNLFDWLQT